MSEFKYPKICPNCGCSGFMYYSPYSGIPRIDCGNCGYSFWSPFTNDFLFDAPRKEELAEASSRPGTLHHIMLKRTNRRV